MSIFNMMALGFYVIGSFVVRSSGGGGSGGDGGVHDSSNGVRCDGGGAGSSGVSGDGNGVRGTCGAVGCSVHGSGGSRGGVRGAGDAGGAGAGAGADAGTGSARDDGAFSKCLVTYTLLRDLIRFQIALSKHSVGDEFTTEIQIEDIAQLI